MKRTKAIELLDQQGLPYQLSEFKAEDFTAEEVAQKLNVPISQVFKTIVFETDQGQTAMAVIPGNRELNLKKAAQALSAKRAALIKVTDLTRITGYQKGGCSPLGSKKSMPVLLEESCQQHQEIYVSAGLRGLQLIIAPEVLIKAAAAQVASLAD